MMPKARIALANLDLKNEITGCSPADGMSAAAEMVGLRHVPLAAR
jgi:hypothetical protein